MNVPELIPFKAESPQPLLREIPRGSPYPVEALGPLQKVAKAVHDITQAPIAVGAQSALSIAALAVQPFADVETLGGDAPCSLFCLTIAESGERKSTCDRLLLRSLRDFERDLEMEYRDALADWHVTFRLWTAKRDRLVKDVAGGNVDKARSAEADLRGLGAEPRAPLFPNVTAAEPTFEGLVKLYQGGRPSLGLFTDEAGGFIGGHAMNADNRLKTMAGLSNLWNGEPVNRTRAGDGAVTLRGRRLSAHLMAQPVVARSFLADREANGQGFLPRFLICEPRSTIGTRFGRGHAPESMEIVDRFAECLRKILKAPLPFAHDLPQELHPRHLPLSDDAKKLLWDFNDAVEQQQRPGGDLEHIRAYASKVSEQAARIAGVLSLWADLNAPNVSPEAMGWGLELAQFYLTEARRLSDAAIVSVEIDRAETLRRWMLESWTEPFVLPSDVLQKGPSALRESPKARRAISILEKHGWLVRLPEGAEIRGAVRKEAYRIVRASNVV